MFCPLVLVVGTAILSNFYFVNGENILFMFAGGTYSHQISVWPLVINLADKNHSVTFFSAHMKKPWEDKRINFVMPPEVEKVNSKYLGDTLQLRLANQQNVVWDSLIPWSFEMCEYILKHDRNPEISKIIHEQQFDVVIVDSVLCDCGHIVGYHHKAKVIVFDSTSVLPWYSHIYGFPTQSSWIPSINTLYDFPMNLPNVISNFWEPLYWTYMRRTQLYPKLENLMEEFFNTTKVPLFLDLERDAKLILINSHPAVEFPRAMPPNFIDVAGMQMHGQKNATIPADMEKFIEEAIDGVILLAFGSSVDFSILPKSLETEFFESFRRFPNIHFLVRASGKTPVNGPINLRYDKWIPQKEVLGHSKTLACITHGGLNGIIEATWTGVPLITMPIFAEQDYQSYKLQARNLGIRLEIRDLRADDLAVAIKTITTDSTYRENMKKMQKIFKDRPISPVDLATYYVQFVINHDDLSFMNPMKYQPWKVILDKWCFSSFPWIACTVTILVIAFTISISTRKQVPVVDT